MDTNYGTKALQELLDKVNKMTPQEVFDFVIGKSPPTKEQAALLDKSYIHVETAVIEKLFKEYCDVFEMNENDQDLWHTAAMFYHLGKKAGNGEK